MNPYTEIQDRIFEFVRARRTAGEEAKPLAILGTARLEMVLLGLAIPQEMWKEAILEAIDSTRAKAVILIYEAWALTSAEPPTGSIEHAPGRREVILAQLETADGLQRILQAEIQPDGSVGPVEEMFCLATGSSSGFFLLDN